MDVDDDDMDQAPSSSTGAKGEKKRFEVKKVINAKISLFGNSMTIHFVNLNSLDNKAAGAFKSIH